MSLNPIQSEIFIQQSNYILGYNNAYIYLHD